MINQNEAQTVEVGGACPACGHIRKSMSDHFRQGVCESCYNKLITFGLSLDGLIEWRKTHPRKYVNRHKSQAPQPKYTGSTCLGCGRPGNKLSKAGLCYACLSLKYSHGLNTIEQIVEYRKKKEVRYYSHRKKEAPLHSSPVSRQEAFNSILDRDALKWRDVLIISDFSSKKQAITKIMSDSAFAKPLLLGVNSTAQDAITSIAEVSAWATSNGNVMTFVGQDQSGILCFELS